MSLNTKSEAIIHFIEKMDIEMISDLLDDDRTYQDMSKSRFLALLENVFNQMTESRNSSLTAHKGKCGHEECINIGKAGFCFAGNKTKHHINLIIEEQDGKVKDIYECDELQCPSKDLPYEYKVNVG